jgi:hypothetical protein
MKKTINLKTFYRLLLFTAIISAVTACKKSDNKGPAPIITRVRTLTKDTTINNVVHRITLDSNSTYNDQTIAPFDSTVTSGQLNYEYYIVGQNLATTTQILFNGVSAYFNPAEVTNTGIIISIPTNAPWGPDEPNKLTVVTKYGSVSSNFTVQQPPPVLNAITPMGANAGDTVVITGTVLNSVSAVLFGTTPGKIVSSTATQINVIVPAGIIQSYVYVTTPGGTTRSAGLFGLKYVTFNDVLTPGWWSGGWSVNSNFASTAPVETGTNSIQVNYTGNYGGFQMGNGGADINVANLGLKTFKLSIYGTPGTDGKLINVTLNGNYTYQIPIQIKAGVWTDYTLPLSDWGSPTDITEIDLIEGSGNAPCTVYLDNVGFN